MYKHGLIGQPVSRIDGPLKVEGKARFAAEVPIAGIAYAALAYSTIARGTIKTIDTAVAEAAPGVVLVMTYLNAPRLATPPVMMSAQKACAPSDLPIMQDAEIHWNGQPVALVLAETQDEADYAVALIRVSYQGLPAATSFDAAKPNARVPDSILGEPPSIEIGDAETALEQAEYKVGPDLPHASIQPQCDRAARCNGGLGWGSAHRPTMRRRWSIQRPGRWRRSSASRKSRFGFFPPMSAEVSGGKGLWDHQILAAAASRMSGRPVRIVLSREGVFRLVGGRTTTEQRVAVGAQSDGALSALIHTGIAAMTTHNNCPEQFTFPARHLYAAEAIKIGQKVADMDMLANTFMRRSR